MRNRFLSQMMKIAIAATAVAAVISFPSHGFPLAHRRIRCLKTSWGENRTRQSGPTTETAKPLQRSPKSANQELSPRLSGKSG